MTTHYRTPGERTEVEAFALARRRVVFLYAPCALTSISVLVQLVGLVVHFEWWLLPLIVCNAACGANWYFEARAQVRRETENENARRELWRIP